MSDRPGAVPSGTNRPFPAYVNTNYSKREIVLFVLGIFFIGLILRNIVMKDYDSETRSYLTKVGKSEAIDKIVPKTYKDIVQERAQKEALITHLSTNMTFLLEDHKRLRGEVEELKAKLNST